MDVRGLFDQGVSKARGAGSSLAVEQRGFVQDLVRLCGDGCARGWHERNGGNASYRLTAEEAQAYGLVDEIITHHGAKSES